jgi:hypothetical protein
MEDKVRQDIICWILYAGFYMLDFICNIKAYKAPLGIKQSGIIPGNFNPNVN